MVLRELASHPLPTALLRDTSFAQGLVYILIVLRTISQYLDLASLGWTLGQKGCGGFVSLLLFKWHNRETF